MRVLITGASSGIGLATAGLFLDRGAEVVGLDLKRCPPLADQERYSHYVVDVCEKGDLPDAGRFDIVVNNAGVQTSSMRGTGRDIRVNLCGAINVTERYAFQPQIKSVLFNASASGVTGDEFPEYVASKAGVIGYMRNCAKRLAAEFHATCNATCFGGVRTDVNRPVTEDPDLWKRIMAVTPLKRWATADEAAEWIYFLTAVNKFCTGQAIVIDGGEKDCNSGFVWPMDVPVGMV